MLVSDAYDPELAASLESSGGFLLVRPIQDIDLERVLKQMDARGTNASAARPGR